MTAALSVLSARDAMRLDYDAVRHRTRRMMLVSVLAHILLFAWILVLKPAIRETPDFTEITLLDPGDLAAAPAAAASAASGPAVKGLPKESTSEQRFTRARTDADVAPRPQSAVTEDRIAARLSQLQRDPDAVSAVASAGLPNGLLGAPAGISRASGGGGPISLSRGGTGASTGPALPLTRGGGSGLAPAVVSTGIGTESSAGSAPARSGESTARKSLAGAEIMGPVADRPVLHYLTPVYPEWAKRDAVEGSTTLYFIVRPDGTIRENVLVQKTAGFEDFDDNARAALREWRFKPLGGGRTGDQWGTITFHFRLREGNQP